MYILDHIKVKRPVANEIQEFVKNKFRKYKDKPGKSGQCVREIIHNAQVKWGPQGFFLMGYYTGKLFQANETIEKASELSNPQKLAEVLGDLGIDPSRIQDKEYLHNKVKELTDDGN